MSLNNLQDLLNKYKKIHELTKSLDIGPLFFSIIFWKSLSKKFIAVSEAFKDKNDPDYMNWSKEGALNWKEYSLKYYPKFFLLPEHLFDKVYKLGDKNNIDQILISIFKEIEKNFKEYEILNFQNLNLASISILENKDLGSDREERNKKIWKIMEITNEIEMDFGEEHSIDKLGYLYEGIIDEFFIKKRANSGQYFTPPELSKLLSLIVTFRKNKLESLYDPTCGTGSLLIATSKTLKQENIKNFYGQELDTTTHDICRMNMFLHGIDATKFDIFLGHTIKKPKHIKKGMFEAIVSNPPFNNVDLEQEDIEQLKMEERFENLNNLKLEDVYLLFVFHCLYLLNAKGICAMICPNSLLTNKSLSIKEAKSYLILSNLIDNIINLPDKLFQKTGVKASIIVLNKSKKNNNVLFINATKEFERYNSVLNKLSDTNIEKIMSIYSNRQEIDGFSKLVSINEIKEKDFSLNIQKDWIPIQEKTELTSDEIKNINKSLEKVIQEADNIRAEIKELFNLWC